jgi:16S rRNA (cytosine967-C5)-methyltransferase
MIFELSSHTIDVKLPNALIHGVLQCLKNIFIQGNYADKAVANMLKEQKAWGSRDRKTASHLVYSIVRKHLLFKAYAEAVFQMTDEDPEAYISALFITGILHADLPLEWTSPSGFVLKESYTADIVAQHPALRYSIQDWMFTQMKDDWGEQTEILLSALDVQAPVYVRRNDLKITRSAFEAELKKLQISFQKADALQDAYVITGSNQLRQSKLFKEGKLEFQDIGSQLIVAESGIQPGMTVVDFCAGKGGKTLQIGGLLKQKGKIIASDLESGRLNILQKRALNAGIQNLTICPKDRISSFKGKADIVLVDAPCTGSGTFRRQPDLKFRLQQHQLADILPIQAEILREAAPLVKPGGNLVYATCSIFKDENERQISNFLKNSDGAFQLEKEQYLLPHTDDSDGFYFAVLKKTNE